MRGDATHRKDELRCNLFDLGIQENPAMLRLGSLRVAIIRGAALDDIGDINLFARDSNSGQHAVEQLPRAPDKGFAAKVFIVPGAFADDQQIRLARPDTGNILGTIL